MDDKATLAELRDRYFADRRWKDLVDVLQREIPLTEDRAERLDLYEELGSVAAQQLRDVETAFDAFRTVIDLRHDWSRDEAAEIYRQLLEIDPGFVPAFERLEELLRAQGDIDALHELAARYLDRAEAGGHDAGEFLRCQGEAAKIFELDLGDPDAALVVLCASINEETWQTGILDEAERLAHRTGAWDELVTTVRRLLGQLDGAPSAARLHRRLGIWLVSTGRAEDATEHLLAAQRHLPGDAELQATLQELLRTTRRWDELLASIRRRRAEGPDASARFRDEYVATLREAAASDEVPTASRAAYLAELATIHDAELDDRLTAVTLWERALNLEPETIDAARPLVDHYLGEGRWERAAPVLETVIKAAEARRVSLEPRELNDRYLQYGQVLDMLGNEKLALHAYRQAYEIDRNNPRTLERLGLLLYEAGELDQAYHAMVALVDRHEKSVAREVLVDVLQKAAEIKRRHGDYRTAEGLLERAARIAPRNTGVLRAIAKVGEDAGDLERSIKARRAAVDAEDDPQVKFRELVEIGDAWNEAGRHDEAARAFVAALDVQESSVAVLRKLLETFRQMGRWREAVGVLDRLVGLEPDRVKRGHLRYTMGIIARDELRSAPHALQHFEAALDENPELLKAFEAIDRLHTEARAWKELERAYRRMLHRVTENELQLPPSRKNEVMFLLWKSLGEVYRSRLGQPEGAIKAFEAAQALRPDDDELRMILAELFTVSGGNSVGAIAQHRSLLEKEPRRLASYEALFRAYLEAREFDRAWCVAAVVDHLGGDREAAEYHQRYLGWNLKLCRGQVVPEILDRVYPRTQNRVVNAILAHLAVGLRKLFAHSVKDYGVNPRRDLVSLDEADFVAAKIYEYVARTLNIVPPPELYVRRDHPLGIKILNAESPSVLLGSDMLQDFGDDRALTFRIAKVLAWLRPEHYLAAIGNTPAQLTVIFVSAMDWALGRRPTAGKDGASVVKHIKGMPSQTQMQLQSLLRVYLERTQEPPDLGVWITAAEMTTSRLSLLLCNDLQRAVAAIESEPAGMTAATTRQRVDDLLRFASSEAYSDVRKELGLAIG